MATGAFRGATVTAPDGFRFYSGVTKMKHNLGSIIEEVEELHDWTHVLFAANTGISQDGANEEARVAIANFSGDVMVKARSVLSMLHDYNSQEEQPKTVN